MRKHAAIVLTVASLLSVDLAAQWLDHQTPAIPRLPNGKANLAAPTPRKSNGGRRAKDGNSEAFEEGMATDLRLIFDAGATRSPKAGTGGSPNCLR